MANISLINFCLKTVVNRIDQYMAPYIERRPELVCTNRPTFGVLAQLDAEASQKIIEYLIARKLLKVIHLQVLLDESATKLPCNENSFDTIFTLNVLSLIARRCRKFEEIHFHGDVNVNSPRRHFHFGKQLEESLLYLSTSVTVIDFTDAEVESSTLKNICFCFKFLRVLNLHSSRIGIDALENLVHPDSIIKNTIESLTVDKTLIKFSCTANCLIQFKKMKYFKCDWTIAAVAYFQAIEQKLPDFFRTTVLKQDFYTFDWNFPDLEYKERVTEIVNRFPFVNHVIFTSIQRLAVKFINIALSVRIITKLQLSCFRIKFRWEFVELQPAFDNEKVYNNLTSLTLECFDLVDVYYLGKRFKKLQKLVLINNTYRKRENNSCEPLLYRKRENNSCEPLLNLEELEVLFLSEAKRTSENVENFHMNDVTLLFLMSSRQLKKIVILNQNNFQISLKNSIRSGFLRNLRELIFLKCKVEIELLQEIFNEGIPIERLEYSVPFMNLENHQGILQFVRENYNRTTVVPHYNLVYWFRWSLVNIPFIPKRKDPVFLP